MDTLIDNRTFPVEMQEHTQSKHKKSTPWMLIVLILIALGVLVFLAHRIFQKREVLKQAEEQKATLEQQRSVVDNFEAFNPQLTTPNRREKVQVFFGNNNS